MKLTPQLLCNFYKQLSRKMTKNALDALTTASLVKLPLESALPVQVDCPSIMGNASRRARIAILMMSKIIANLVTKIARNVKTSLLFVQNVKVCTWKKINAQIARI